MSLRPPSWGLSGAVAVISGGGAGLGRACAEVLASCGASVAVLERDPQRATDTAAALDAAGARALGLHCDVRDADQVAAAVAEVIAILGKISHIVNNAGGVIHQTFADSSPKQWAAMWRSNVESTLLLTHAVLPHLGDGSAIVNVTTVEAHRAAPDYAVYAAGKAAVASLTRSLAVELAPRVRVNAVAPDLLLTDGIRAMLPPGHDPGAGHIPLRRAGRPEELAHAVAFLLSPLSSYITGVTLPIDGGTLAAGGWIAEDDGGFSFTGSPTGASR
jgi:NAD(P)-dependent dehydrogenase (short-subunit alcohol dehydrogenase family)